MDYAKMPSDELVRRCSEADGNAAWTEFVRRFHRPIAIVVMRTARKQGNSSHTLVEDLIQDTYFKICADNFRVLREFAGWDREAFTGFVKVIAKNVTRDHFRRLHSGKQGGGKVEQFPESYTPAAREDLAGSAKSIETSILLNQVERVLLDSNTGNSARNRRIFWLHHRFGYTASTIATFSGVDLSVKGVEAILLRMKLELREKLRRTTSLHENLPPGKGLAHPRRFYRVSAY